MKWSFLIVFLLGISQLISYGQDPIYDVIGEEELSNENIYSILWEEENELLYIATNNGVFVRKQNKFVRLTQNGDHIGDAYFNLQQHEGEVFCFNLNGQIFRVNDSRLDLFFELGEDEFWSNFDFKVLNDQVIVHSNFMVWSVDYDGNSEVLLDSLSTSKYDLQLKKFSLLGSILISENEVAFTVANSRDYIIYNAASNSFKQITPSIPKLEMFGNYQQTILDGNVVFVNRDGELYSDEAGIITDVAPIINERYFALNSGEVLCMGPKSGGRILGVENDTIKVLRKILQNKFISNVTEASDGTLFLGTFGEGVIVIPNRNTTQLGMDELFLGIDVSGKDEVFFTTRSGKIFRLADTLTLIDVEEANVDRIFCFEGDLNLTAVDGRLLHDEFIPQVSSIKDAVQTSDSTILIGFRTGVAIAHNQYSPKISDPYYVISEGDTLFQELWQTKRVIAIDYFDKEDKVLFATSFGLRSVSWNETEPSSILLDNKEIICSDILALDDVVLLGTSENGILTSNLKKTEIYLTEEKGLWSNSIIKIEKNDSWLFILGEEGLQVFDMIQNKFVPLGYREGLVNHLVKNFALGSDRVWMLYKNKIASIHYSNLMDRSSYGHVYIDSALVNGELILESHRMFSPEQNHLKVYYDYRDVITKDEVQLSYRLQGFSEEWIEVSPSENLIEFKSLPPGDYSLVIKSIYRGNETLTDRIEFKIDFPYYQKLWFYILLSLAVASLIGIIAIYRIKTLRKRNAVKIKLLENESKALMAQLKAIRAQMNPHFIFNSITSIQDLILKDKKLESYDYLEEFSKMVRSTLEMSEKEFVSVEKEVEYLDVYIKLEQLRFKDDFTFDIQVNSGRQYQLPSLFLQPLVENSIKHGLRHQSGPKKLDIIFNETDHHLVVEIIDNGIGRDASMELNKNDQKKYESFSTEAIKNRILILNGQYEGNIEMEYLDLKQGTKVQVKFPLKFVKKRDE